MYDFVLFAPSERGSVSSQLILSGVTAEPTLSVLAPSQDKNIPDLSELNWCRLPDLKCSILSLFQKFVFQNECPPKLAKFPLIMD